MVIRHPCSGYPRTLGELTESCRRDFQLQLNLGQALNVFVFSRRCDPINLIKWVVDSRLTWPQYSLLLG